MGIASRKSRGTALGQAWLPNVLGKGTDRATRFGVLRSARPTKQDTDNSVLIFVMFLRFMAAVSINMATPCTL